MSGNKFSPEEIAKSIGYPMPVAAFGMVRWENEEAPYDFVLASSDGFEFFVVEVYQRIQGGDVKTARLRMALDGSLLDGFILGGDDDIQSPEQIVTHLTQIISTLGFPCHMDSDFPSSDEVDEVIYL